MKTSLKIGGLVAAMMLAVSGASFAADQVSPYVHSADGQIVKSGFGLCWRTNFGTPALAEASGEGCQCDADVLPAEACQPKQAAAPVAPAAEKVTFSASYADRLGKDAYNEKLSAARAESVKTYLVSKGVDANLIQTEGRGEADPVVDCPNPSAKGQVKNFRELVQCLAPNRRAVVEVVGTRQ